MEICESSVCSVAMEGAVILSWMQPGFRGQITVILNLLIRLTGVINFGQASAMIFSISSDVGTCPAELLTRELRARPT